MLILSFDGSRNGCFGEKLLGLKGWLLVSKCLCCFLPYLLLPFLDPNYFAAVGDELKCLSSIYGSFAC